MHRAASVGDIESAKLLFELGGKILVNAPDVANRCPALYADRHDQFDFLEWIMEKHGAVKEIRRGDAKRFGSVKAGGAAAASEAADKENLVNKVR